MIVLKLLLLTQKRYSMSIKIENAPSPSVLMNSLRSIGYTFETALADIIDNSISAVAKNIYISAPINDEDLYISILDDGNGMSRDELFNAMKYGSDREYKLNDLGRFGLGLKSASLSQCRILTVISKSEGVISGFQWNVDSVISDKKWDCIELEQSDIKDIPNIEKLYSLSMGTLVVWQNFDIAYKKSNGHIREYISEQIEEAEKHIRLVFHRFLSNRFKQLNIFINDDPLIPIDPFLEDNPKTDTQKVSELTIHDEIIKVQPFILPHQSDLQLEDIEKLGGINALRNGQGFYIYRNDRLIIYGTWFRLSATSVSSELLKYGRIKVDIPNTLDDVWDIDIKKQHANIPKQILNNLKKVVRDVCSNSRNKTSKRAKLTLDKDDSKIWNKSLSRNGKEIFYINQDSLFVKQFLDDFNDSDKVKILNFIEVLSTSIPFDDIYNAICNKKNEIDMEESQFDAIVAEGISQFKSIKRVIQQDDDAVFMILVKYEPFNNERVINRIKEIITNEK